jgi:hypothetical protein
VDITELVDLSHPPDRPGIKDPGTDCSNKEGKQLCSSSRAQPKRMFFLQDEVLGLWQKVNVLTGS